MTLLQGYFYIAAVTSFLISFSYAWELTETGRRFNFENGVKAAAGMSLLYAALGAALHFAGVL
jgi:hypothetical protein